MNSFVPLWTLLVGWFVFAVLGFLVARIVHLLWERPLPGVVSTEALDKELAAAKAKIVRLNEELAAAADAADEARVGIGEEQRTEQIPDSIVPHLKELERSIAAAKAETAEAEEALLSSRAQLATAETSLAEAANLRSERDELGAQRDQLNLQVQDLATKNDAARREVARLTKAVSDAQATAARHAASTRERSVPPPAAAPASTSAPAPAPAPAPRAYVPVSLASALPAGPVPTATELRDVVDRVGRLMKVQEVAISDAQGFAVAGSGERVDALAALAAYLSDVSSRVRGLVPGTALEVSVETSDGSVVRTRRFGDADFSLITVARA